MLAKTQQSRKRPARACENVSDLSDGDGPA